MLAMVFRAVTDAYLPDPSSAGLSEHAFPGPSVAPAGGIAGFYHLEVERDNFVNLGFPPEVIDTSLASQKAFTIRIYNAYWKTFHRWCRTSWIFHFSQRSVSCKMGWSLVSNLLHLGNR